MSNTRCPLCRGEAVIDERVLSATDLSDNQFYKRVVYSLVVSFSVLVFSLTSYNIFTSFHPPLDDMQKCAVSCGNGKFLKWTEEHFDFVGDGRGHAKELRFPAVCECKP